MVFFIVSLKADIVMVRRHMGLVLLAHDGRETLRRLSDGVLQRDQLGHGGHQARILALDGHLLAHADVLASIAEGLFGLVVVGFPGRADGDRNPIPEAKAQFLARHGDQRAQLDAKSRLGERQVEGEIFGERRVEELVGQPAVEGTSPPPDHDRTEETYLGIDRIFVPAPFRPATFQLAHGVADGVLQQSELAGDEGRVVGVAGPDGDVDDVQRLVDALDDADQLRQDDTRRRVGVGQRQSVPGSSSRRCHAGQTELHVLPTRSAAGDRTRDCPTPVDEDAPNTYRPHDPCPDPRDKAFEHVGAMGRDDQGRAQLTWRQQGRAFLEADSDGGEARLQRAQQPIELS